MFLNQSWFREVSKGCSSRPLAGCLPWLGDCLVPVQPRPCQSNPGGCAVSRQTLVEPLSCLSNLLHLQLQKTFFGAHTLKWPGSAASHKAAPVSLLSATKHKHQEVPLLLNSTLVMHNRFRFTQRRYANWLGNNSQDLHWKCLLMVS